MAETDQNTTPQNPGGTGNIPGTQPPVSSPATPPQNGGGAASGDEETVTLKKTDYNNLIGQRDSSNNELSSAMSYIENDAREKAVNKFLTTNKEKYPDLSTEDLSHVDDPQMLETEATRLQTRLQQHAQSKILEIENHQTPRESAEDRAAREAEAAKNPSLLGYESVLAGRLSSIK